MRKISRRDAVVAMGSIATIGSSGIVGAKSKEEKTTLREVGIEKAVRTLLHKDKFEQAVKLAEKHNVGHSISRVERNPVSTQDTVTKSYSWIDLAVFDLEDSQYHMYAGWHAEASGNDADCGQPHDAFAISFSEDIFRPISGTEDNGFYSPNHATDESLTNTDFRHHGYKGEWNDKKLTSNWKGYLEVDIEERDSTADTATLYSDWIHTYTSYCVPSGMGVGFDFPGAGTLTINSQDVSVVKWRLEDNLSHSIV